jgi:tRNA modification GTPase
MNLGGLPVTLLDTAGLRQGLDEVEKIGISRGMQRAEVADIRVFLLAGPDEVTLMTPKPGDVVVLSKADLHGEGVSGLTGQGVEQLIARIVAVLEARVASAGVMTRERHRVAMVHAIGAMELALDELERSFYRGELVAAELRRALLFLDQLVGRIDVENLLDEIFASFCIGK